MSFSTPHGADRLALPRYRRVRDDGVVQTSSGARITIDADVVDKLHRAGTDPRALRTRLLIAARLGATEPGCLLAPLTRVPIPAGDRWLTRWPRVEPVDPQHIPWADAARLLARLHAVRPGPGERRLPHGWPARLRRSLDRLRGDPSGGGAVRRAAAGLPPEAWRTGSPDRPVTLVHGDWHLGQLGRRRDGTWTLLDVDDLGVGDPAWDLARPAGFWAAGLIPDRDWEVFLDAYREAGGVALPPGDPWPVLEPFARAAVVQGAAGGCRRDTAPDESHDALVAACARMPQLEKNNRPNPPLR